MIHLGKVIDSSSYQQKQQQKQQPQACASLFLLLFLFLLGFLLFQGGTLGFFFLLLGLQGVLFTLLGQRLGILLRSLSGLFFLAGTCFLGLFSSLAGLLLGLGSSLFCPAHLFGALGRRGYLIQLALHLRQMVGLCCRRHDGGCNHFRFGCWGGGSGNGCHLYRLDNGLRLGLFHHRRLGSGRLLKSGKGILNLLGGVGSHILQRLFVLLASIQIQSFQSVKHHFGA